MEELDLLKKAWQKDTYPNEQISEVEIYKMLHTKSSSIVKWILIISILEVTLWTAISLFFNTDEVMVKNHTEYMIPYFKITTYFNYAVVVAFIYGFYVNYKNNSTLRSTKKIMQDKLKKRRTVKYYVWYNLIMIGLSAIAGFVLAFVANPQMQKISHNPKAMVITIIILVVFSLAFFGIAALFYYLIYGTLMKRLFRNYNELKKIDLL